MSKRDSSHTQLLDELRQLRQRLAEVEREAEALRRYRDCCRILSERTDDDALACRGDAVLASAHDAVIVIDDDDRVVAFNPAAEHIFGYRCSEILGRHFTGFIRLLHEHEGGLRARQCGLAANDPRFLGQRVEATALRADGSPFPVELSVAEVHLQGRTFFTVCLRDVTERKRIETEQRESERRFRTLFENSPDAIFVEDLEGNVLDANPAACRLHHVERDQLVGLNIAALVPPSQREQAMRVFARLVEGEVHHIEGYSWTPGGQAVAVEIRASHIAYAGQPAVLLHVRDVTERERFEKELIDARDKAEEMSRLKTAFLNNMSHEIRTPLTAIIGFSGILAQEASDEQRELIELIQDSGKRLLNTLNAVLDLSMLEAGSLTLEREWLDVVEVVREKVEGAHSLAREKGVQLVFSPTAASARACLDRTCLDRIVSHLIDNAIKFTEEGRVAVRVCVEAGRLCISVDDTGVGICKSFRPHLFEAFKQESTGITRSHIGAGLGLSITQRMVALMGGEITVRSEKHKGSVFEVTFPVAVNGQAVAAGFINGVTAGADHHKPRVLAVEDSPDIALLLEHMLEGICDLTTTPHEQGALASAWQTPYDLVLMDINLGGGRTGEDVLAVLRDMPGYANVPVVAMTAYALLQDRERFLEAGFDGYLSKPFTISQLHQVIRQALRVKASS